MSHLHEILNHHPSRPQPSKLSQDTAPVVDQLEISSSAEDDISGFEDDEIDELDEESEDDDFYDEEPSSVTPPASGTAAEQPSVPLHHVVENMNGPKMEPKTDSYPLRQDEKRAEPAPRRKHEKHDRKIDLGLHDHKAHADCPDTLACLPDTHGRPQHTLPVILRCAILGSPRKRLTIREIYATMESKYPYYKTAGQTWKQSVRHHLSLNRLFERQPRPVTDPGFGSYWTVNLSAPPGTKRPRKRGRPNKDALEGTVSKKSGKIYSGSQPQLDPQPVKFQFQPQSHPPPPPPPLPHPQVNTLTPRPSAPHHHHTLLPMPTRYSSPSPRYHSPPPSHPPHMQPTPTVISLQPHPTPPPPQPKIHHHNQYQEHGYTHPNQNHRQTHPYPPTHISLPPPEPPQSSSLSPQVLPPPPPAPPPAPPSHHQNHHHQQFSRQDSYHSHQRSDQHRHPQYSALSQHASQHSSGYPSLLGTSHSQSLPPKQNDLRRPSVSHPQRKASTHLPISSARESAYPLSSSRGSETEDGAMEIDSTGVRNDPTVSDGEYESEEDMNHRYQRRPGDSAVFVPSKPSPIFALPPFSVLSPPRREDLLEQMRQEIMTLRRTSAEAVSTSIRLSEQLANANLEVSRSREAVRDLEDMLQDEASKRKEAEKLRGVEMERRRAAEDVLSGTHRSPTRVRAAT